MASAGYNVEHRGKIVATILHYGGAEPWALSYDTRIERHGSLKEAKESAMKMWAPLKFRRRSNGALAKRAKKMLPRHAGYADREENPASRVPLLVDRLDAMKIRALAPSIVFRDTAEGYAADITTAQLTRLVKDLADAVDPATPSDMQLLRDLQDVLEMHRGRRKNPGDIHIDIHSHNTRGRNVRAKNPAKAHTISVHAVRWFQRTYGNTYHAVAISIDGQEVWRSPVEYGYGDAWAQTAAEWLAQHGYIADAKRPLRISVEDVAGMKLETHVDDVDTQRDLKAFAADRPKAKRARAKNPEQRLSKADHFSLARQNLFVWRKYQQDWLDLFRKAFRETYGRDPSYGDTNVSGVGNAGLPENVKEKLREINRMVNRAMDDAHAHYKASGKRSWAKFKEADTPAMKRQGVRKPNPARTNVVLALIGSPKGIGYYTGRTWDTEKGKAIIFDSVDGATRMARKLTDGLPNDSYRIEVRTA